jgi:hypothetical protein
MSQSTEAQSKAVVLEAFDTLFNKRDYGAAERFWSLARRSLPLLFADYLRKIGCRQRPYPRCRKGKALIWDRERAFWAKPQDRSNVSYRLQLGWDIARLLLGRRFLWSGPINKCRARQACSSSTWASSGAESR